MPSQRYQRSIKDGCVVVAPTAAHTHTIIFLHGRGSNAKEFKSELFESEADGQLLTQIFPQVRWEFPNATVLRSAPMPQWFEMWSTDNPHEREIEQLSSLDSTLASLRQMIEREAAIVGGAQNIVLAGISQGCTVAVHALLGQKSKMGGFIGLSSWIPNKQAMAKPTEDTKRTPVFLSHSENDIVIRIKYGEELRDSLKQIGMQVEWHAYKDGGHWLYEPTGAEDMVAFLNRIIADSP